LILRIGDVNTGLPEQERYAAVDDTALQFESYAYAILQVFNPTFWYIMGLFSKGASRLQPWRLMRVTRE